MDVIIDIISCRKAERHTEQLPRSVGLLKNMVYWLYLFSNEAVFIDVVKVECPSKFLCNGASKQHR